MAGQMPAEVARQHAGVEVVAAAGPEADRDGHGLAGESVLRGCGGCRAERQRQGERGPGQTT